jgi:hypothetical protein
MTKAKRSRKKSKKSKKSTKRSSRRAVPKKLVRKVRKAEHKTRVSKKVKARVLKRVLRKVREKKPKVVQVATIRKALGVDAPRLIPNPAYKAAVSVASIPKIDWIELVADRWFLENYGAHVTETTRSSLIRLLQWFHEQTAKAV